MSEQQRYFNLLLELQKINEINRNVCCKSLGLDDNYGMELGTIQCYAGRQCGNSYFINQIADYNDLIISINRMDIFTNKKPTIININEYNFLDKDRLYNNIFIDNPSFIFKKVDKEQIYKDLYKDKRQTVYLLGM